MNTRSLFICAVGFLGGALVAPIVSSSLAQHHATSHPVSAPAQPLGVHVAPSGPQLVRQIDSATHTWRLAAHPAEGIPTGYFGTTPAKFLGIRDNGCRFFVTSSQAEANSWTGPNDPRSRPCTPTANSFSPMWSSTPTQAQIAAWEQELGVLASRYPSITLQQAQPLFQAALANVKD